MVQPISGEERESIRRLLRERWNQKEIASYLGMSFNTMRARLAASGYEIRTEIVPIGSSGDQVETHINGAAAAARVKGAGC